MLSLGYKRPENQLPRLIATWNATAGTTSVDITTMKGTNVDERTSYLILYPGGHTNAIYVNPAGTASTSNAVLTIQNPLVIHADQVGTLGSTTGCNIYATSAQIVSVLEIQ